MWQFNAMVEWVQWSEIEHPIDQDNNDEALDKLDFHISTSHGSEYGTGMKIYRGPNGQFYVIVTDGEGWVDALIANQPSLFEFIRLYGQPYTQMAHASEIHDLIEELRDLLLDRGSGHFRDIVRDRDRREESIRRQRLTRKVTAPPA